MNTVRVLKRFRDGEFEFTEIEITKQVEANQEYNVGCKTKAELDAIYASKLPNYTTEVHNEKSKQKEDKPVEKEEGAEAKETDKKPEATKPKRKKKSTPKKKAEDIKYDRENGVHKELFVDLLNDRVCGWDETPEGKMAAKKISVELAGTPFLDSKNNMLGEFTDKVVMALKDHVNVDI